jgi:hypothetical protein
MSYYLDLLNNYPNPDVLPQSLNWTNESGVIVYRMKIDTVIGVKHPGIVLGKDQWGFRWIMHHHFSHTYPIIEREDRFAAGNPIKYDDRPVCYDRREIVERAIESYYAGKEYSWLNQNCQQFVNEIACDNHYSESVEEVSDGALLLAAIFGVAGLATKNKTLLGLGVGLGVAGGIAKAANRNTTVKALPATRLNRLT